MIKATIIIALLSCCSLISATGNDKFRVSVTDHGFLINWVSFQLEAEGPAPTPKKDAKKDVKKVDGKEVPAVSAPAEGLVEGDKEIKDPEPVVNFNPVSSTVWKFYIFAKYYKKLVAGEIGVQYKFLTKDEKTTPSTPVDATIAQAPTDSSKKIVYSVNSVVPETRCADGEVFKSYKLNGVSYDSKATKFVVTVKAVCEKPKPTKEEKKADESKKVDDGKKVVL